MDIPLLRPLFDQPLEVIGINLKLFLRGRQLLLHGKQPQVDAHLGAKFVVIERLDDVIVRLRRVSAQPLGRRSLAGNQDYLNRIAFRICLDEAACFIAVHAGHHDVQQDKVRAKSRNRRQALLAAGGRFEVVLSVQDAPQDIDIRGHVVHEQYAVLVQHGDGPCEDGFGFSGQLFQKFLGRCQSPLAVGHFAPLRQFTKEDAARLPRCSRPTRGHCARS